MVKRQLVRRIIMGDSHARGMANELQHGFVKSFEVIGIVNYKKQTPWLESAG
jgi:hypothetical protein